MDHELEEWRLVINGSYEVSSLGKIRRSKPGKKTWIGKELKTHLLPNGYIHASPTIAGKNVNILMHRLVAEAFFGACPKHHEVNHIDGNKINNRVDNLEYVTRKENVHHAIALGLMPQSIPKPRPEKIKKPRIIHRGEAHWMHLHPELIRHGEQCNSKVTQTQVDEIRSLVASGIKQKTLCVQYNLSPAQICRIVNKTRWNR